MADQQQQPHFSEKAAPRFADEDDLESIALLGWPMENPEEYEIVISGDGSENPGRLYVRKGYIFCFWLDEAKLFVAELWNAQVRKRLMEQKRYAQRQLLNQNPEKLERLRQLSQNAQVKK